MATRTGGNQPGRLNRGARLPAVPEPHGPFPVHPRCLRVSLDFDVCFVIRALIRALSPSGVKEHPVGEGTVLNAQILKSAWVQIPPHLTY